MIVCRLCAGHTMKKLQNWLMENLTEVWVEEVWLPSSPDCKPFDYFVCGVSELWVKAVKEDEGGVGVPCQGHPGEGLLKLQVQDRGCLYS